MVISYLSSGKGKVTGKGSIISTTRGVSYASPKKEDKKITSGGGSGGSATRTPTSQKGVFNETSTPESFTKAKADADYINKAYREREASGLKPIAASEKVAVAQQMAMDSGAGIVSTNTPVTIVKPTGEKITYSREGVQRYWADTMIRPNNPTSDGTLQTGQRPPSQESYGIFVNQAEIQERERQANRTAYYSRKQSTQQNNASVSLSNQEDSKPAPIDTQSIVQDVSRKVVWEIGVKPAVTAGTSFIGGAAFGIASKIFTATKLGATIWGAAEIGGGGYFAYSKVKEWQKAPSGIWNKLNTVSYLPMEIAAGGFGYKTGGEAGQAIRFIGKKGGEIAASSIVEPKVLSGETRFPSVSNSEYKPGMGKQLLQEFQEGKYNPFPKKEGTSLLWHASPTPISGAEIGAGTSETAGLYGAPSASTYFLKIGGDKGYSFSALPKFSNPTLQGITTPVERLPIEARSGGISKMFEFMGTPESVKSSVPEASGSGIARISPAFEAGLKSEKEAVIPFKSSIAKTQEGFNWWEKATGFKYWAEINGKKVPITTYEALPNAAALSAATATGKAKEASAADILSESYAAANKKNVALSSLAPKVEVGTTYSARSMKNFESGKAGSINKVPESVFNPSSSESSSKSAFSSAQTGRGNYDYLSSPSGGSSRPRPSSPGKPSIGSSSTPPPPVIPSYKPRPRSPSEPVPPPSYVPPPYTPEDIYRITTPPPPVIPPPKGQIGNPAKIMSKKQKTGKFGYGYNPSLSALYFNVRGGKSSIGGVGVRPILRNMNKLKAFTTF